MIAPNALTAVTHQLTCLQAHMNTHRHIVDMCTAFLPPPPVILKRIFEKRCFFLQTPNQRKMGKNAIKAGFDGGRGLALFSTQPLALSMLSMFY